MALDIITLRKLSFNLEECQSISMTADLKLICFAKKNKELVVSSLLSQSEAISLPNIESYLWQDVSVDNVHRLLCIADVSNDLVSYSFDVPSFRNSSESLTVSDQKTWNIEKKFSSFILNKKDDLKPKPSEILRYEEKEVVICFAWRYVVTFFHYNTSDPRITSFVDISECVRPAKQFSLVKETIFVLDHDGAKLYAYSVSSNSKVLDVDLTKCKASTDEKECMQQFAVSLEKDVVVFCSSYSRLHYMNLGDCWGIDNPVANGYQSFCMSPPVTAFSKQFPSVQRGDEGFRRLSMSLTPSTLHPVILACDKKDMNLDFMTVYNGKLCFLFAKDSSTLVGIHQLSIEASTSYRRMTGRGFLVQCSSETFPLLLVHDASLSVLLHDIEQNKLINELMVHQYSGSAETLSDLNSWQNIVIDIEVLKQGLNNRQLDAIKFFLRTREERYRQFLNEKDLKRHVSKLRQESMLWIDVMDLLSDVIENATVLPSAHHFAEKLLQIATSTSVQLLQDIDKSIRPGDSEEVISQKKEALLYFCKCLGKLQGMGVTRDTALSEDSDGSLSDFEFSYPKGVVEQWKVWDEKHPEDIFAEAIIERKIELAQTYFLSQDHAGRKKWSSIEKFHKFGNELVSEYLKQGQLSEAMTVLLNLGMSVNEKLMSIFKSAYESDVRQLLSSVLRERKVLTDEDEKTIKFVSILEKLYPCSSFEHARSLLEEKNAHLVDLYECAYPEPEEDTSALVVGDFGTANWGNCETGAYCRITMSSVSLWSDEVRDRIILPHILKGSLSHREVEVSSVSVWNYLLEYGDISLITKWILSWLGQLPEHTSDEFPFEWSLDEMMINSIPQIAPAHISEQALNELAKFGVFCEDELEDITALLSRLGKAECCLTDPSLFSSEKATISFIDFSHRLIHYCLKHNLIHFLYEFWKNSHERLITWPTCQLCDVPLLKMVKSFGMWSENGEDCLSAYNAMVSTAEKIYGIHNLSCKTILTSIPAPLNIAILLFYPTPLRELIRENLTTEADKKMFKDSLRPYSTLYDTFFKSGDKFPEVSMYKLLQGNTPFDISRLFGWQSTNELKSEDALPELPHFSMPNLNEQHGLKYPLTYFYYLIEGRPNFAFLKFLAQEISKENRISLPRVQDACKEVSRLAMIQFKDVQTCSACIIFHELLGQDSLPLRICLINANFLHRRLCLKSASKDMEDDLVHEVIHLFTEAEENKDESVNLIKLIEAEILDQWKSEPSSGDLEDLAMWMPLMALANYYDVEAGESFLLECAAQNDWLKYLLFAQIFQVPKIMVLNLASKFAKPCIGNHLCKALEKRHQAESDSDSQPEKETFKRKTDLRKSLYARLGVTRGSSPIPPESSAQESEEESLSICSEDTTISSEAEPFGDPIEIMGDLFSQVLYAHNTETPWLTLLRSSYAVQNPVLSVLAASYPDSDIFYCFTTWLAAALPQSKFSRPEGEGNVRHVTVAWTEEDFEALVTQAIKDRKILTLTQGFYLFLPSNPLFVLMEFLVAFVTYRMFDSSASKLKAFKCDLQDYKENESIQSPCYSRKWIENIAVLILKEVLLNCSNDYERQLLLRHFAFTRIENNFSKEVHVPMFSKLYQIAQCLGELEDAVSFEYFLLPPAHPNYKYACWKSVEKLFKSHSYLDARLFARVADMPLDEVLIRQIQYEVEETKKKEDWKEFPTRIKFWKEILSIMKQNNLSLSQIITLLKSFCSASDNFGEKCYLMQLIIECQKEFDADDVDELTSLRTRMWECCMKEVARHPTAEELELLLPPEAVSMPEQNVFDDECLEITLHDEKEIEAVEQIICAFLKKKKIDQAFHVARVFCHNCYALNVITTCLKLAKGELDPKSLLLSEDKSVEFKPLSRRKKSTLIWVSSEKSKETATPDEAIVQAIENYCDNTDVASAICEHILYNYITSVVLGCSYEEVSNEPYAFAIIKRVLASSYREKYSLAKGLIEVNNLSEESVAAFISQEIYFSIRMLPESIMLLPESKLTLPDEKAEILYNPTSTEENFQITVKLCQNTSLLGKKLLNLASLASEEYEISSKSSSLLEVIELCISAHNCFTAACDVEGISQILRKCKTVARTAAKSGNFSLMVRMLTGIGRYSEMSYIFDMLLENGKFELLFGVKMKKAPALRLALLDYLKRCPEAEHYYGMLLETFSMFREIAEDAEILARKRLSQLINIDTDSGLQMELEYVIKELTHAAKNYLQVDCINQAQICADLARLVALQIHLHPEWIVGLSEAAVSNCIKRLGNFSHAVIVAEAYKHNDSWGQAVFNNVILKENRKYLRDMNDYFGVPESVVLDVVRSYQSLSTKTESQTKNVKWILSFCSDIQLRYQLACQLEFQDVMTELLMGEAGSYLQDSLKIPE